MTEHITVIIPAYNPGEQLIDVVQGLQQNGLMDILIINDGSEAGVNQIFDKIQNCTILKHESNQGKGRALKTAFSYCEKERQETKLILTVDADGQHLTEDILACAKTLEEHKDALVLGCRTFEKEEHIPLRSSFGNNLTRMVFRLKHGIHLQDTQTGLRGFSAKLLPTLLEIPGERYEYETNMLIQLYNEKVPFVEVPIHTVYLAENEGSHFCPIKDSVIIYKGLLGVGKVTSRQADTKGKNGIKKIASFSVTSLLSTGIDLAIFSLMGMILSHTLVSTTMSIFISTVVARVCSSLCNYFVNKKLVFRNGNTSSLWKYYLLCSCQMLVSASLVNGVVMLLHSNGLFRTVIKAIIDTTLFFASFFIQKNWVFRTANKD